MSMRKGFAWFVALFAVLAACLLLQHVFAEDAAATRGLDWLQAQVQANGSLSDEGSSLALTEQVRTEAAHTLAQAGRTSALPDLSPGELSDLSTELLARRMVAMAATGQDASPLLPALAARANADGGFGGGIGQPSNPLDTAQVLLALRASGAIRDARVQAALGYLGSAANADGIYTLGQSAYTTAYALQAFARYRNDYALTDVTRRTRTALLGLQGTGGYGDATADAVAAIALAQSGPASDAAAAITALRNAQLADGSWQDDPYITAIALRALLVAAGAPSTEPGQVVGVVYDASSGLPLGQAQIRLEGFAGGALSGDGTGAFSIVGVPAGHYALSVAHAGYTTFAGSVEVAGATTTNIGRISLGLAPGSAVLRGMVTDAGAGSALANVDVQVVGGVSTQTRTGTDGRYELLGLPAGSYAITFAANGYQTLSQTADLPAQTAVTFSPAMIRTGDPAPTSATLTGRVVSAADGAAIAGATIAVNGRDTSSDADGRFRIADLAAGAFTGSAQATGFDSVALSGVVANGGNDVGQVALRPSQATTARTLYGMVTSSATGEPIAGAGLTLNGADAGQTDANGQYRIGDTASADVELVIDAAGFQPRTLVTRLENPGTYRLDAALADLRQGSFQVLNLRAAPDAALPGDTVRVTADIANLSGEARSALVLVRILDGAGEKVQQLCGATAAGAPEQCEFAFDANQTSPFALDWKLPNLPAGAYTLSVQVVEPGSILRDNPLGLVYGSASRGVEVKPVLALQGTVVPSPPVMIPGSPAGVDFSVTVQNRGNAAIPAGQARLRVSNRADGSTAFSAIATLPELLPNGIAELAFGHWQPPADGAQYDLAVTSADPAVDGAATGEFFVGDAASAEFTVDPVETGDGTQRVHAALTVRGVDNPSGQAADPLFTLVRQAVTRGGAYTGTQAVNWQRSNNCIGCHIQTQSLYGLASSLDKADIDRGVTTYLHNSQSANIQRSRAIYNQHPQYPLTQALLGLWSMNTWPDAKENFNARYRVAKYLYSRRYDASATGTYWWRDHDTGWLVENPAPSATAVEGLADVLRDASEQGIDHYVEYASKVRAQGGGRLSDIAAGSDDRLYVLREDGTVQAMDPESGTLSPLGKATGGQYGYGITVAADGTVYVATGHFAGKPSVIERVSAAGNEVVFTLPDDADSIDVLPDGRLAILCYVSRRVYVGNPADGSLQLISTGGLIPSQARSITALPDGAMLVSGTHSPGLWLQTTTRVAQDGSQRVMHQGVYAQMTDVALAADGTMFAGGSDAIYHLSANELVERFATGTSTQYKLAFVGTRLFGIQYRSSGAITELIRSETPIAAELEQMRTAVERTARYFETYSDLGIPAQAFRLILLAEARPLLSDDALAASVDARIPQLRDELRASQHADGGWSRYNGWTSDPLTTAIVGTALDYTHPAPTDPVLRKTVQYLLTHQGADGSWSGQYFSTRLGATSYVMAYLPKAVARLGGIDVGLGLDFAPNVRLVDSSVTPTSSSQSADGSASYFFALGRIGAVGTTFLFTFDLLDMKVDEWRQLATRAFLRFINSFTGETVDAPIAIPSVHAANGYQLDLALNRNTFRANETVELRPTVRNVDSIYSSGSLRYFIETAEGTPVAELSAVAFSDLTKGMERVLPQPWQTGASAAGDYRARVLLLGTDGQVWGEVARPFRIEPTSTGPQLGSSVDTDRPIYDPIDRVVILGRVSNQTLNSGYADLTVTEVVTGPAGEAVHSEQRQITTLPPASTVSLSVPFGLVGAPAGRYLVTQTVLASNGSVLDTRTAQFDVRSSTENGSGLAGNIGAEPSTVEQGEGTSLIATVRNAGNARFDNLSLVVSVIDPASETVLASWNRQASLEIGESTSFSIPWGTDETVPGTYQVVLQAILASGRKTLAYGPVTVIEPPVKVEMTQSLASSGRVLVLMTCRVGHGSREDVACTRARAVQVDALLTRLGVEHTVVLDTEAFAVAYATGRYDTYWISGGAQKLANPLAEEIREAVFQGDGLIVDGSHDSRNQILDDPLGVRFAGELAGDRHAVVMQAGEFPMGSFAVPGDALRYVPEGATAHGTFDSPSGVPAFFSNQHGDGHAILAAYDWVAALAAPATAQQTEALLLRALQHVLPAPPTYGVVGGYLRVRTDVANLAKQVELTLRSTAIAPLRIEDATPAADPLTALEAQWSFTLGVAETRRFLLGLRLPAVSGDFRLETSVALTKRQDAPLASQSLAITVAAPAELTALLVDELEALPLQAPAERGARQRVVQLLQQAEAARASADRDGAIQLLLKAIDELAKIQSTDTAHCHVQLATLVKAARVVPPSP